MNPTANQLSAALGLSDLPEAEQQQVLADMTEIIQDRMSQKLAERFSNEELAQLDLLEGEENEVALLAFLEQRIPDYQQLLNQTIQEAVADIKGQSVRLTEYLRQNGGAE